VIYVWPDEDGDWRWLCVPSRCRIEQLHRGGSEQVDSVAVVNHGRMSVRPGDGKQSVVCWRRGGAGGVSVVGRAAGT